MLAILLLLIGSSVSSPTAPSRALAAPAAWVDARESGGVIYLLFASPPRIERFAAQSGSWLSPLTLPAAPTAFTVDADGIYVSFGRSTSRFSLSGANETHLINTIADVQSMHTIGGVLYLIYTSYPYGTVVSLNKQTGATIASHDYLYEMLIGTSVAPTKGLLFGRDTGLSPADIIQITLNSDGTLGGGRDSPYHGAYPSATRTFVFPGDARVADDSGIVYNTADLTYNNSLAGAFDDLAFYGDLPIVLRGGTLYAYSNTFQETGRYVLGGGVSRIFVLGTKIYALGSGGANGATVTTVAVGQLTPLQPGQPVDPTALTYTPDGAALGTDGVLYLLSRSNLSIFRWSIAERRYLASIPLAEAPRYMAYADVTHRIYLAYPSGRLTQIRLAESLAEQNFANTAASPCGFAAAGDLVFACDPVGAWLSHDVFSPAGTMVAQREWNYFSTEYIWSAANRKMYFFRDDTSPNDLIWEDIGAGGALGAEQDSPYHDSTGIVHPIRVSPDGTIVLLGSGRIYDATSLVLINSLANDIGDAAWGSSLYTVRAANGAAELQKWGANYGLSASRATPGAPLRLFNTSQGLLALTNVYGTTRFSLWDSALAPIYASPTLAGLSASQGGPAAPGQPITFTATLRQSAGPISWSWSFGDGTSAVVQNPSHSYAAPGSYTAVVTASNGIDTLTASARVTVTEAPIAGLAASNDSPTMQGYATLLRAQIASGSRVSYTWAFGDGGTGNGAQISHSYAAPGSYTAVVTASNTLGSLRATTLVTITDNTIPLIQVAPAELRFEGTRGDSQPLTQTFTITNGRPNQLSWVANEMTAWLRLSPASGSAPAVVTATVDLGGLSVGSYSGQIAILSAGASATPKIIPVTLVVHAPPTPIQLGATSGYHSIQLAWEPIAATDLATYRVERQPAGQAALATIASTTATSYIDEDSALQSGAQYCYRVTGLRADGSLIAASNIACSTFGQVELWVPSVAAAPGQTAIVPINLRNASALRIAASDIWLDYDARVIEPIAISATPLTLGYTWSYGTGRAGDTGRLRIAALSSQPPALYGDGSLVWVTVRVLGKTGDSSPLDLREFIGGVGGSTIYTPENLAQSVPLALHDGSLVVAASYMLGDLNGNGAIEAADAYLALQIANSQLTPSEPQRAAGDVNGDGRIDAADATAILYYAANGHWPAAPALQAQLSAATAGGPRLQIDPASGAPGGTATVTISASQLADWAGGTLAIAYDPALVAGIQGVSAAGAAQGFAVQYYDDGAGLLHVALASSQPVSASGAVLRITLRLAAGQPSGAHAPLVLAEARLNDLLGRDFATSALNRPIERVSGELRVETPSASTQRYIYLPLARR
jgi:PKD repeat protein